LRVVESGIQYNQTVDYDPLTADVITYVPEHHRDGILFRETTKIENIFLGLSVWREGEDEHCYFRHLMSYESPLELSRVVDTAEARNEIVDSMSMIQVIVWASIESEIGEEEREDLTTDMNNLCYGVPILKMKTEVINMDEFEKRILDAGECYTGHTALKEGRKKRAARRREASCTSCYPGGHRPRNILARAKRSIKNSFGLDKFVHLIIGHERFGCE